MAVVVSTQIVLGGEPTPIDSKYEIDCIYALSNANQLIIAKRGEGVWLYGLDNKPILKYGQSNDVFSLTVSKDERLVSIARFSDIYIYEVDKAKTMHSIATKDLAPNDTGANKGGLGWITSQQFSPKTLDLFITTSISRKLFRWSYADGTVSVAAELPEKISKHDNDLRIAKARFITPDIIALVTTSSDIFYYDLVSNSLKLVFHPVPKLGEGP